MIYGIGDLHLDHSKKKPMDIFGDNWIDHDENIFENWKERVANHDLVLIPGDISWALKTAEAYDDLKKIDDLPGFKVLIKGNHDYWWQSLNKLNLLDFKSIFFLQNNSYLFNNVSIVGTRGWIPEDSEAFNIDDEKILKRELQRLRTSLEHAKGKGDKIIAMVHYPPFNMDLKPNEFVSIMREYGVDMCIYGHLHAEGHNYAVEGIIHGIDFHCVSSDYIDFKIKKLMESEKDESYSRR